ncbi:MAG: type II toxin-antitoxin system RelE/ParE family toxin [Microscillaceae bacterium]|jgi:plasmid stabilization system protein ParE|nr:type II toxin-antitoxin system RelE/ParE family toxin [Microscillaceae bacterium]
MAIEVIWSPRAEAEFANDLAYLEENTSKKTVLNYLLKIAEAIEKIAKPEEVLYQAFDEERKIYRYKIDKHKWLYYRFKDDKIEILTFWDTRQNPDKLNLA